jgi:beta-glucosidase
MNLMPHEYHHREQLRKAAAECVVLLKKDGAFPLSAPCRLALYGNGARNTAKGGTGSGDTHARNSVTVEAGLAHAGFAITTKAWLDAYDQERAAHHASYIAGIRREAAERGVSPLFVGFGRVEPEYEYTLPLTEDGDACVYVLARTSGEGNDRTAQPGDVRLTNTEITAAADSSRI